MRPKDRVVRHCSPDALKLLGDYTTLRIIDFLSESALRFTDLRRALVDTNAGASKVGQAQGGLGEEIDDPKSRIVAEQLERVGRAVPDDSILRPHTTIILLFGKKY